MSSSFTLEKVLANAKCLVTRLKDQESTVDCLLSQTQDMSKKVESMKMYEENLNALNELAKQRPQAELTVGLFQESSEIGQLKQENGELRQALDNHQSAIELIMSRYRSRVSRLVAANRRQRDQYSAPASHSQAHEKIQDIQKMADVMWSAVTADSQPTDVTEYIAQLQLENSTLREVLSAGRHSLASPVCSQGAQTDVTIADDEVNAGVSAQCDTDVSAQCDTAVSAQCDIDVSAQCDTDVVSSSVVEVSENKPTQAVTTVPSQAASSKTDSSSAAVCGTDIVINDNVHQET